MAQSYQSIMSDEELGELDEFLLSGINDSLSLDEAHGYLTALIVAASPVPESEWLESIWGEPEFESEAQAERMTALMQKLYQDIEEMINSGVAFEPLVVEEEGDEEHEVSEVYEGWCFGFMLAVTNHEKEWDGLSKAQEELLTPIATLALLNGEEEMEMEEDEYYGWVEMLPGSVAGLYQTLSHA